MSYNKPIIQLDILSFGGCYAQTGDSKTVSTRRPLQTRSAIISKSKQCAKLACIMSPWREGRRIVDLSELAKNMYCKRCSTVLDLNRTEKEARVGLASVLYVGCHCGMRNDVHTDAKQQQTDGRLTYFINMVASASLVQCGMMGYMIQNLFAALKVPMPAAPFDNLSLDESPPFSDPLADITFSTDLITAQTSEITPLNNCAPVPSSNPVATSSCLTASADSVAILFQGAVVSSGMPAVLSKQMPGSETEVWQGLEQDSSQQTVKASQETTNSNSENNNNNQLEANNTDEEADEDEGVADNNSNNNENDDEEEEEEEEDDEEEDNEDNEYPVPVAFENSDNGALNVTEPASSENPEIIPTSISQRVVVQNTAMILNSASADKPYGCGVCFKAYVTEDLCRSHIQTHIGDKPYLCEDCGRGFVCEYNLKLHKRQHTGERPYRCEDCGRGFIRWFTLKRHRQKHQGVVHFTCQVCGDAFSSRESLKRHRRVHTGEKPFSCDQCDKTFRGESNLYAHRRRHFGIKPYKCSECEAAFVESTHLTRHRRTHTKEQPYICEICGARYTQSGSLAAHRKKHTGEPKKVKVLQCTNCGKIFNSYTQLKRHKRIHTGEKPYVCEFCQMAFTQSSSLKAHRRIHTGERPFKCEQCGESFLYPRTLKRHVKKHAEGEHV